MTKKNLEHYINFGICYLQKYKIKNLKFEIKFALKKILKIENINNALIQNSLIKLTSYQKKKFLKFLNWRAERKPFDYFFKEKYFYNSNFKISQNCLIPRSDSEILVEIALKYASEMQKESLSILDICSGSGCLGLSILKELNSNFNQLAMIDISTKAIELSRRNAKKLNLSSKVKFIKQNILDANCRIPKNYDIIISNPPYLNAKEMQKLEKEVKFEPKIALSGGFDGLIFYKKIAYMLQNHHKLLLFLEIGQNQENEINKFFKEKNFILVDQIKDYNQIVRVLIFKK